MIQRILPAKKPIHILTAIAALLLLPARTPAEPVLGKQDPLLAKMVCYFLQKGHLNQPQLNEEISRRLFRRFLKDLDPAKIYFLKTDVEEFKEFETQLTAMLQKETPDLSFAYKVYKRFAVRLGERVKLVEELVKTPHDFTVKEFLDTDYDALDYPQNNEEMRERWRKRIKYDLLLQRLGQKPVPEAEA